MTNEKETVYQQAAKKGIFIAALLYEAFKVDSSVYPNAEEALNLSLAKALDADIAEDDGLVAAWENRDYQYDIGRLLKEFFVDEAKDESDEYFMIINGLNIFDCLNSWLVDAYKFDAIEDHQIFIGSKETVSRLVSVSEKVTAVLNVLKAGSCGAFSDGIEHLAVYRLA